MSDDTVYVTPADSMNRGRRRLHLDRDCRHLHRSDRVSEKRRSQFPDDQPVCKRCRGVDGRGGRENPQAMRQKLLAMDPDDVATDGGRDEDPSIRELEDALGLNLSGTQQVANETKDFFVERAVEEGLSTTEMVTAIRSVEELVTDAVLEAEEDHR